MKYIISISFIIILFLSGCSNKEIFKPTQNIVGSWPYTQDLNSSIIEVSSNGAVFKNGHVLYQNGIIKTTINNDTQTLINVEKKWIITAKIDGELTLINRDNLSKKLRFLLGRTVVAATVDNNILAVLFASDNIALYNILNKKILFQAQGEAPIAIDTRVVNPYFLNNLVVFSTLDSRLVIVNIDTRKIIKALIVSTKQYFNNIIHFNVAGNNLVAASGYKILSLKKSEKRATYDVRDIKYANNALYVATKQGVVYELTPSLQLKVKIKFAFAHFLGMTVTKKRVYLLLKQGYIVSLDKNFKSYKIYDVDIDENGYVYTNKHAFYVNDKSFILKY